MFAVGLAVGVFVDSCDGADVGDAVGIEVGLCRGEEKHERPMSVNASSSNNHEGFRYSPT